MKLKVFIIVMLGFSLMSWESWATSPKDVYGEQVLAGMVGSVGFGTLLGIAFQPLYQALLSHDTDRWCKSIAAAGLTTGGGAYMGMYLWSRLVHKIQGEGALGIVFATGGAILTGMYLCQGRTELFRSPWVILAAQVVTASLLAPLGYNIGSTVR